MAVPNSGSVAGLYQYDAHPGEPGTAVIAGHRSWNKKSAIFDKLHLLKAGDIITISNINSIETIDTNFVVTESKIYAPKSVVPRVFTSPDFLPHLNLISCTGAWDANAGSASERLVVFAVKV